MKIKRLLDDINQACPYVEIELTKEELIQAYKEQEDLYQEEDIRSRIDVMQRNGALSTDQVIDAEKNLAKILESYQGILEEKEERSPVWQQEVEQAIIDTLNSILTDKENNPVKSVSETPALFEFAIGDIINADRYNGTNVVRSQYEIIRKMPASPWDSTILYTLILFDEASKKQMHEEYVSNYSNRAFITYDEYISVNNVEQAWFVERKAEKVTHENIVSINWLNCELAGKDFTEENDDPIITISAANNRTIEVYGKNTFFSVQLHCSNEEYEYYTSSRFSGVPVIVDTSSLSVEELQKGIEGANIISKKVPTFGW